MSLSMMSAELDTRLIGVKRKALANEKNYLEPDECKEENESVSDEEESKEETTSDDYDEETDESSIAEEFDNFEFSSLNKTEKGVDEYAEDSSDEEDVRNTVGNIPINWYDEFPHVGYDLDGKPIEKEKVSDTIDEFLKKVENPDFWRTIKDPQTGKDIKLKEDEIDIIERIRSGMVPDPSYQSFEPWIEWFSSKVMDTPLRAIPDSKASFLPSKIEKMKISRLVHAIKMGRIKPKTKPQENNFYMLWDSDDKAEEIRRIHDHIPAPKTKLPTNAESYNPPAEYLFDEKEKTQWEMKMDEPWKRKYNFIPQKHSCLRKVPAYNKFTKERFERCLDLYLCPRTKKMKLTIKAEDLVPQLPNPKDLEPFPTTCSLVYTGHKEMVRSISMEPFNQFFVSGSDDGEIKIWEISTGRCMKTIKLEGTVRWVEWCPSKSLCLIVVAVDFHVVVINPGLGDKLIVEKTDLLLSKAQDINDGYEIPERLATAVEWEAVPADKWEQGFRISIKHFKTVKQVSWHGKGDYFAAVMPDGINRSVVIHRLSTRRSQLPLSKYKGQIQCVQFHPIKPFFFVVTQRHVRIYDLSKQEMIKKLMGNSKWISSISIHPGGDNVLIGTYDKKVNWFDLDLSTKPYQTLKFHSNAVRSVAYHKRYPLFASASDDLNIIICHGMVYNDLLQNPLIVPVKKLRSHEKYNGFGVLCVKFHESQPWVFSSGADKTIRLYT